MPEWADKAATVLASVPGFQSARIESLLTDGLSHQSFLLNRNGETYVLRVDKPAVHTLGLDRAREHRLASIVASAGLCPHWLEHDLSAGWAIRAWWPGQCLERQDLDEMTQLSDIACLLRELHALRFSNSGPDNRQDRAEPLFRYSRATGSHDAESLQGEGMRALKVLENFEPLESICHNDLVCQNLVRRPSVDAHKVPALYLVDLEYAALGDPFFDLATVIEHHELKAGQSECLLEAYLGTAPNSEQSERLGQWRQYYQCLLGLWNLRVDDLP